MGNHQLTITDADLKRAVRVSTGTITLFGLPLRNDTLQATARLLTRNLEHTDQKKVAFVNADCINQLANNTEYQEILDDFDHLYADGVGMRIAAKMQGHHFVDNVNGTDLFPLLAGELELRGKRIFLLGGKPGIAEKVADYLQKNFPALEVAGEHHGYFDKDQLPAVLKQINQSRADIVLVAMGAPRQEHWINNNSSFLDAKLLIGVGGLFDIYSGTVSRAPLWLRKLSLEWVWRLMMQPADKAKRYLVGNPIFLIRAWKDASRNISSQNLSTRLRRKFWRVHPYLGAYLKRSVDIGVSSLALIILSPLLLATSLLIKFESPGPVIFRQTRVGKHGKELSMYKFRSMCVNAESLLDDLKERSESKDGVIFKLKNDPRITAVGRVIRLFSIDELPQLINVLNGSMSLVGPRPPLPSEVAQYDTPQTYRLQCKPGITCIWQVSGRSDIPFSQQVEMDIDYIQTKSFFKDLAILLRTVPAVLLARGAY
jgi:exopolysaccharide biosynthesis WecB/TagA/CpsF family protein